MNEVGTIFLNFIVVTLFLFGAALIIKVCCEAYKEWRGSHQKHVHRKESWRGKKIKKDGIDIDKLAKGFSKAALAGRQAGISISEVGRAMATLGNRAGPAAREIDPHDELINNMMTRMAEQTDRDMMAASGDPGKRGAAAGANLRAEIEGMINLRSELRTELIERIHPDRREPWPDESIYYRGQNINEMNETEIRAALNRLRPSSSSSPSTGSPSSHGFSSVPELEENKTKIKITKRAVQRRKIR